MRRLEWVWLGCAAACLACSSSARPPASTSNGAGKSGPGAVRVDPGTLQGSVSALDPGVQAFAQQLTLDLKDASMTTPAQLQDKYALSQATGIAYDATAAQHMDLLQASSMKLDPTELERLGKFGFAVSSRQFFPTFAYGYAAIYASDLPVYISADSIADALHRSYDQILAQLELALLRVELSVLLGSLQIKLSSQPANKTRADLDTYLSVAQGLLNGKGTVSAGGDQRTVDDLIAKAEAASGTASFKLFGVERNDDMSQYKPRGHYENDPQLQTYFRAMMWLGRVDFRLVETVDDTGMQVLRREQVDAMLLLYSLFDAADLARFHQVDDVVRAFVGESDNMTLSQVPDLLATLGVTNAAGVASIADAKLQRAILENGFGKQQILSHLMAGGLDAPVPLNASFLLFGQRYIVDSHVLSNVTWDRVRMMRMMPDPLDVAFAALGNDQAASLLKPQLEQYDYAGNLAGVRTLIDAHDDAFWQKNLYNDWLSALRALSPERAAIGDPAAAGLPAVMATEAWGRRMLNTQLASWAQLRHDTIVYAKQSYTSVAACHFPDAAIDPYPAFYAAVGRFAAHGYALAALTDGTPAQQLGDRMRDYFGQMRDVASMLESLAKSERAGSELSQEQLAFINDAVVINRVRAGCTTVDQAAGWYTRLFFDQSKVLEDDPTIADVHTQPTDEAGNDVGRILHVATAEPQLMVVTEDGCGGPKAYVGLASSYYEQITEKWRRMADSDWVQQLRGMGPPAAPTWLQDLVPATQAR